MSNFFQELKNENFFMEINPSDQKNIIKALSFILPVLILITLWDKFTLNTTITLMYILVKAGVILSIAFVIFFKKIKLKMSPWLFGITFWMFVYSFYGTVYIHFTYCYSFLEMYFVTSFFFRFSKKSYMTLMSIGGILNIAAVFLANEPDFIKAGMSFKPHIAIVSVIIYFLTYLLFFNVTKRKEELFKLQEKFAIIGKQSSYIFHEIKKPINRLMKDELQNNDIQQINDIMLNIDLMLKDPENFQKSFVSLKLTDIYQKLEKEFENYFKEYGIVFSYPHDDYSVLANQRLIYQVFKNLTVNAIEGIIKTASPDTNKKITISYVRDSSSNKVSPKIHFHNTGSYISPAQKDSVFNPFYSTKGSGSNHGLGLSFCQNILEGHRGEMKLITEKTGPLFVLNL